MFVFIYIYIYVLICHNIHVCICVSLCLNFYLLYLSFSAKVLGIAARLCSSTGAPRSPSPSSSSSSASSSSSTSSSPSSSSSSSSGYHRPHHRRRHRHHHNCCHHHRHDHLRNQNHRCKSTNSRDGFKNNKRDMQVRCDARICQMAPDRGSSRTEP